MVLDSLGKSLRGVLQKIARGSTVDEELLGEVVRDIQRALLQADVNVQLTLDLTQRMRRRAREEKPPAGSSLRDFLIRIIYEEIRSILGEERDFEAKPRKILLVGLYGQGKTTTAGKLARFLQKKGVRVGLIAADVHRPAAIDQLEQLSKKIGCEFYADRTETRAEVIVRDGLAKIPPHLAVIVDTAGRSALDADLISELRRVREAARPDETILVLDAAMGQTAGRSAAAFQEAVGLTGTILTKMDGSAKGGGALSAVAATHAPVLFLGTGEHLDELERFIPTRFVSRLLGMGDLQTLLERFEELRDKEEAQKAAGSLGSMAKLLSFLPGLGQAKVDEQQLDQTQRQVRRFRAILDSLTPAELLDANLLKGPRIQRAARGSGHRGHEVRAMLRYYETTRKTAHGLASNRRFRRQFERQMAQEGKPSSGSPPDMT
ncbi:MAG: signal recognition particle receptor subunit alpha [Thermoplasmatales archaeon]|nr:signal recognition particle receptor subunit alpha [Thermoplasmatales archaeon]